MPEERHWHIVMYDVRADDRLRKTRKVLESWGSPLQYSVFRVRGTSRELERLRFELARVMEDEDRLMVVRLCPSCAGRVVVRGDDMPALDTEIPAFRIV